MEIDSSELAKIPPAAPVSQQLTAWGHTFPNIPSLLAQVEQWKAELDPDTFQEAWIDAGCAVNNFTENVDDTIKHFKGQLYELALKICNTSTPLIPLAPH